MKRTIVSIITGASLLVCASGCAMSTDATSSSEDVASQDQAFGTPIHVFNQTAGKCVRSNFVSSIPVTTAVFDTCNANSFDQSWQLNPLGTDPSGARIFQITQARSVSTRLCLELPFGPDGRGVTNGALETRQCLDGLQTQLWKIRGSGGGLTNTLLVNVHTGQCLVPSPLNPSVLVAGVKCSSPGVAVNEIWDLR